MNNKNIKYFDEELDIPKLFSVLWAKKYIIICITILAATASIFYALSLPNIYISKSLLVPAGSEKSLSSRLGGYSSLAGLAGISLPANSVNKSTEAIERIKSYDFFIEQFLPNIEYKDLVAAEKWNEITNTVDHSDLSKLEEPTYQEAYEIYQKILFITEDKKTSFISMKVEHISPFIAQKWLILIINNINSHMRDLDIAVARNSLNFLNNTIQTVNLSETRIAISNLIEGQIKILVLAESNEDYVFKPISFPIAPEKKSGPTRSLICIYGTVLGFLLSIIISLISHYLNVRKV